MIEVVKNNPLSNFRKWIVGHGEYKPIFILLAFAAFFLIINMPTPESLENLLTTPDPVGYATEPGNTIVDHLSEEFHDPDLTVEDAAWKVKIVIGMLAVAAILWGTVAIPLGATGFLLAAIMYAFHLMPIDIVAKSYMKDAVFFIIGALTLAVGVEKTGLHNRLGLIFLGWTRGRKSFLFLFGPLMAVTAMFISAKCLIAFKRFPWSLNGNMNYPALKEGASCPVRQRVNYLKDNRTLSFFEFASNEVKQVNSVVNKV